MEVKIQKFKPMTLACVRHVGSYDQCSGAWEQLFKERSVMMQFRPWSMILGLCYDDPETTEAGEIWVAYDTTTYDSHIDMYTDSYINVDWVKTYNLTTDTEQNIFLRNEYVEVRANVSDPFGIHDTSAYVYLTTPGGSYGDLVNGVAMGNHSSDSVAPFSWQIYNHSIKLPAKPVGGIYKINILAVETNNVIVNFSSEFLVFMANVSVSPDHYLVVYPATNVTFAHVITNHAVSNDSFELSISMTQTWNVSIYNDSNDNGALDASDNLIAFDSNGGGTWEWYNMSFDSNSDGNPDTGILVPDGVFNIIVEVEVPGNPSAMNMTINITATSNYESSISDFALDTLVVIPEYTTMLLPIAVVVLVFVIDKKYFLIKKK